jgi:hypothetical protein
MPGKRASPVRREAVRKGPVHGTSLAAHPTARRVRREAARKSPHPYRIRGLAVQLTLLNLLDPRAGLAEADAGAPHVLVVRTPHRGLT